MKRRSGSSMRAFYDWFHRWYWLVEKNIVPTLARALTAIDPSGTRFLEDSFLELACGSGSLGLLIAPRVRSYEGRDQSENMLERARMRWVRGPDRAGLDKYAVPPFSWNDLNDTESIASVSPDWIALSFALHLFPPEKEIGILEKLFDASAKGVIIFDHEQRWSPVSAFIERLEGSWYDQYVKIDFSAAARRMGAEFKSRLISGCLVMEFLK